MAGWEGYSSQALGRSYWRTAARWTPPPPPPPLLFPLPRVLREPEPPPFLQFTATGRSAVLVGGGGRARVRRNTIARARGTAVEVQAGGECAMDENKVEGSEGPPPPSY